MQNSTVPTIQQRNGEHMVMRVCCGEIQTPENNIIHLDGGWRNEDHWDDDEDCDDDR